jgi:hypothetical protein
MRYWSRFGVNGALEKPMYELYVYRIESKNSSFESTIASFESKIRVSCLKYYNVTTGMTSNMYEKQILNIPVRVAKIL